MLRNYFITALRNLKRNASYALINVVGLTLGLVCCLLLFLAIRYELSYDRHHTQAEHIYRFISYSKSAESNKYNSSIPLPALAALRNDFPTLQRDITMTFGTEGVVKVQNGAASIAKFKEESGVMAFVEPEYFRLFDYQFKSGSSASSLNNPGTVVLSEQMARKYFGTADPVGKTIRVGNKMDFQVTGIVEDPPVTSSIPFQVLLSFASLKQYGPGVGWDDWETSTSAIAAFVLLPPGMQPRQMERQLVDFSQKYLRPEVAQDQRYQLQPLTDIHFNAQTLNYAGRTMSKQMIWTMSLIGVFILITACVNFINLATAQSIRRSKEVGMRKVLGSTKGQLIQQFLAETGVLTVFAILLALVVAHIALPYMSRLLNIQLGLEVLYDTQVLVFLLLLTALATLMAGFYPAMLLSGYQPVQALKSGIPRSGGRVSLRRVLIVFQFAISQLLLIGTIVAYNQMQYLRSANLGFSKEATLVIPIPDNQLTHLQSLRAKLTNLPGIASLAYGISAPSAPNNWGINFRFEGADQDANFPVILRPADTAYIRTYGLQLVAGRLYLPADTIRELIVNETFARNMGFKNPSQIIGKRIALKYNPLKPIVGVVKDFKLFPLHKQTEPCVLTTFYMAYNTLGVKLSSQQGTGTIAPLLSSIERAWSDQFPDYVFKYEFLDEVLDSFYKSEEQMYFLFQLLSIIAIFIGCMGLYGVVAYMVETRAREVGIRKALGASSGNIFGIFSLDFIKLILVALVLASPIAWYFLKQWLQDFAYKTEIKWWVFVTAGGFTMLIALLTVSYQSIKAALMSPIYNLRPD